MEIQNQHSLLAEWQNHSLENDLKESMNQESDNFFEFSISYPDSRKGYYAVIIRQLENEGWRVKKGQSVDSRIHVTLKKEISIQTQLA